MDHEVQWMCEGICIARNTVDIASEAMEPQQCHIKQIPQQLLFGFAQLRRLACESHSPQSRM